MKKPNFFIIGAPKCGTTSLAYWLSEHPNIYMSSIKEPYYWCTDFSIYSAVRDKNFYYSLFKNANERHIAIGEASVWYLYSNVAVKNIEQTLPGSKYIVMLRNPVDMLYSLHWQQIYSGVENIKNFFNAWKISKERRKGKRLKVKATIYDPKLLDYQSIGLLGQQLKKLYRIVTPDRVLIIFQENLKKDPKKEYSRVLKFLEVPNDNREYFPSYNMSKQLRFPMIRDIQLKFGLSESKIRKFMGIYGKFKFVNYLRNILAKEQKRPKLPENVRKEIINYYYDDIILLSKLTNKDLSSWLV